MNRLSSAMGRGVKALLRGAADLLLPTVCAACAAEDVAADGLCETCSVRLLSLVALPYCPRCGSTLGLNVPTREDGCPGCPDTLFRFAQVIRLGPYAEPLRSVIHRFKYRSNESMRRRLGRWLGEAVDAQPHTPALDVVLAIPAHWRRRFSRGYDPARLLASAVARRLRLPLGNELRRLRDTPPQIHLPRSQRIANVRGAFSLAARRGVEGAHVLLVDDVTTTGATANEATRTLLAGGASRVTLAVLAKSEPPTAYAAGERS